MDSHSPAASPEAQTSSATNKGRKLLLISICVGVVVVLFAASLVTYIVCLPKKPSFRLDDVSVYPLNASQSNGGSSSPSLMVTLTSINPSRKSDMEYGTLAIYLSVKDKKTGAAYVDGMLQKPKETATWTVVLGTSDLSAGAAQGEKVIISVDGRIQWKIGLIYTPMVKYHVRCLVIFNSNSLSSASASASENSMRLAFDSRCSVH